MKLSLICSVLLLTSCTVETSQKDIVLGTTGIENTWNKAVQDTRNELDGSLSVANDTLVKANMDAVDEEHRFNAKVKAAGSKANSDVLDAAAKANADAVAEEHRVTSNVKDTALKANQDFTAEQARATDKLVGSDDKTVDDHGDRIAELERLGKGKDGTNGTNGVDGKDGATGATGPAGSNGVDGATGATGAAGSDGVDGTDGSDGDAGQNGTNGINGTNGTDGIPGTDGTSCTITSVYFNKNSCVNHGNSNDIKSSLKTITCGATSTSFCVKL